MAEPYDAPRTDEELRQRWIVDLKDITQDATEVVTNYYFYKALVDLAMGGPIAHVGSYFWTWLARAYSDSALVRIRRLCEPDNTKGKSKRQQTRSLLLLLAEIRDNCDAVSLEWYKTVCRHALVEDEAIRDFESLCGPNAGYLPQQVVETDIAEVRAKVKQISDHVDQFIAHCDRSPTAPVDVKKLVVEEAIQSIEKVLNRYRCLLTACTCILNGTIAQDWQAIFRQAWV